MYSEYKSFVRYDLQTFSSILWFHLLDIHILLITTIGTFIFFHSYNFIRCNKAINYPSWSLLCRWIWRFPMWKLDNWQYYPTILQYDVFFPNMQKPELGYNGKCWASACNGWNNYYLLNIHYVQDTVLSALQDHTWSSQ